MSKLIWVPGCGSIAEADCRMDTTATAQLSCQQQHHKAVSLETHCLRQQYWLKVLPTIFPSLLPVLFSQEPYDFYQHSCLLRSPCESGPGNLTGIREKFWRKSIVSQFNLIQSPDPVPKHKHIQLCWHSWKGFRNKQLAVEVGPGNAWKQAAAVVHPGIAYLHGHWPVTGLWSTASSTALSWGIRNPLPVFVREFACLSGSRAGIGEMTVFLAPDCKSPA